MKCTLLAGLAATVLLAGASAQSVTLDVRTAKNGGTLLRQWESHYGSYDRDKVHATFIDIRLGTVGRVPFEAEIEVVFHGKHPATKERLVASWQVGKVQIESGKMRRYVATSGAVKSNATRYSSLREMWGSGTNVASWMVVVKHGGKVIAKANNGSELKPTDVTAMAERAVARGIIEKAEPEPARLREIGPHDAI